MNFMSVIDKNKEEGQLSTAPCAPILFSQKCLVSTQLCSAIPRISFSNKNSISSPLLALGKTQFQTSLSFCHSLVPGTKFRSIQDSEVPMF